MPETVVCVEKKHEPKIKKATKWKKTKTRSNYYCNILSTLFFFPSSLCSKKQGYNFLKKKWRAWYDRGIMVYPFLAKWTVFWKTGLLSPQNRRNFDVTEKKTLHILCRVGLIVHRVWPDSDFLCFLQKKVFSGLTQRRIFFRVFFRFWKKHCCIP